MGLAIYRQQPLHSLINLFIVLVYPEFLGSGYSIAKVRLIRLIMSGRVLVVVNKDL